MSRARGYGDSAAQRGIPEFGRLSTNSRRQSGNLLPALGGHMVSELKRFAATFR